MHRRDCAHLREVLIAEGDHAELPGNAIELPLAGGIAGAGMVEDEIGRGGHAGLGDRPCSRPAEDRGARLSVHGLQREVALVPTEVEHDLDVADVRPRLQVAGAEDEAVAHVALAILGGHATGGGELPLVRRAGMDVAAAINEKLAEYPGPLGGLGDGGREGAIRLAREPADDAAAGDDR